MNNTSLPYVERILTATEWAFDAEAEDNETKAFLYRCIGLEAILGSSDKDNVSDRLANRYAYLTAKGLDEREEAYKEFKELYDLRSKLVHGTKKRLSSREEDFLKKAGSFLDKVILTELTHLLHTKIKKEKEPVPT